MVLREAGRGRAAALRQSGEGATPEPDPMKEVGLALGDLWDLKPGSTGVHVGGGAVPSHVSCRPQFPGAGCPTARETSSGARNQGEEGASPRNAV